MGGGLRKKIHLDPSHYARGKRDGLRRMTRRNANNRHMKRG